MNNRLNILLDAKVIVIAGGAGYIGRELCAAVAEVGAIAVVADLDRDASAGVADDINAKINGHAHAAQLDITSSGSIAALVADLKNKYGRIDALVNSAYPRTKHYGVELELVTYASFCENLNVHLGGYFLLAQQFAIHFRAQGFGNIVNISSIYGIMAPRFEIYANTEMTMPVEYAAIKSAIVHLTKYFAQYYKGEGIRVNCLSPGGILNNQPDVFLNAYNAKCASKGMLDTRDLAGALLFLLSDASKYVTGQNLIVDDGFSL